MSRLRVYIDTSVIGGYYDEEFEVWTQRIFEQFIARKRKAVISDITQEELLNAPAIIKELIDLIPDIEVVKTTNEVIELAEKYIIEGIVSRKSIIDARHIAIATINKIDVLLSWNFKHIVNYDKIRQYNSVNLKYGYTMIDIRNPRDLTDDS